jgi:hypothetical protein
MILLGSWALDQGVLSLVCIFINLMLFSSIYYLNMQIRGMHTLIRDKDITTPDFVFYSDRLIRLVCAFI